MTARVRGAVAPLGGPQQAPVAGPPIRSGLDRSLPGAREVDIDQLLPDPDQPRKSFDPVKLDDLCGSIMEYGLLQPLLVQELDLDDHGDMRYRVIAGGRRLAALHLAQERCADPIARARLRRVPVVLARNSEVRIRVLQLLENLQRADLTPLEEAQAYQEIIDLDHISPPALAARLHLSAQTVRNRLRLIHDEVIADAVRRAALTTTAAQLAQTLADDGLAEVYDRLRAGHTLSVAQVHEIRARLNAAGMSNPRRKGPLTSSSTILVPPASSSVTNQSHTPATNSLGELQFEAPQKQNDFVADRKQAVPLAQPDPEEPSAGGRHGRAVRPTFLRLHEIDAALRNLSLEQASDAEEAFAWLPVLRSITNRAGRLCDALERLTGRETAGVMTESLPTDNH